MTEKPIKLGSIICSLILAIFVCTDSAFGQQALFDPDAWQRIQYKHDESGDNLPDLNDFELPHAKTQFYIYDEVMLSQRKAPHPFEKKDDEPGVKEFLQNNLQFARSIWESLKSNGRVKTEQKAPVLLAALKIVSAGCDENGQHSWNFVPNSAQGISDALDIELDQNINFISNVLQEISARKSEMTQEQTLHCQYSLKKNTEPSVDSPNATSNSSIRGPESGSH
ncbi:MAG: hypothetical protein KDD61_15220 [Bdellovibrionales bacterium]|nr:hypothetical protein [Bdellovibrionales bacterium]